MLTRKKEKKMEKTKQGYLCVKSKYFWFKTFELYSNFWISQTFSTSNKHWYFLPLYKRDPKHLMGPLIVIFRQILQGKHVSKLGTDAAFMYCRGLRHSENKIPSLNLDISGCPVDCCLYFVLLRMRGVPA